MKRILFFSFITFNAFAATTFDLTDPSNLHMSNIYPDYEIMRIVDFNDTDEGMSLVASTNNRQ